MTVNTPNFSTYTYAGTIQDGPGGALSLAKAGSSGTLYLAGTNSYSGGTTLSAGNLTLGNSAAIGSGPLTITGGTLETNTSSLMNIAANVTYSGSPTVTVDAANLELDGAFNGTSGLTKNGPGTLVLTTGGSSNNTWIVGQGTLQLQGNSSLTIANGNNRSLNVGSLTNTTQTLVIQDSASVILSGQMGLGSVSTGIGGTVYQTGGLLEVNGDRPGTKTAAC